MVFYHSVTFANSCHLLKNPCYLPQKVRDLTTVLRISIIDANKTEELRYLYVKKAWVQTIGTDLWHSTASQSPSNGRSARVPEILYFQKLRPVINGDPSQTLLWLVLQTIIWKEKIQNV